MTMNTYENIIGVQKCSYCGQLKTNRKVIYKFPIAGPNAREAISTCLTCTPKMPSYILLEYTKEQAERVFVRHNDPTSNIIRHYGILMLKDKGNNCGENLIAPNKISFQKAKNDDVLSFYVPTSWISFKDIDEFFKSEYSLYYDFKGCMGTNICYVSFKKDKRGKASEINDESYNFLIKDLDKLLKK